MKIDFAGKTIAEDGNDETDVIDLAPPTRSGASDSLKIRGSRGVYFFDNKNVQYSFKARVPYFLADYESAYLKLFELSKMLEDCGEAEVCVSDGGRGLFKLSQAVVSADFPDEITGCFFEVEYEFKGAFPKYAAATAPTVLGCAISVGGKILTIKSM